VKTFLDCMVNCWIPKIFLTNPGAEPSTFSFYVGDGLRLGEQVVDGLQLLEIDDR
jgi:hypothetical protein